MPAPRSRDRALAAFASAVVTSSALAGGGISDDFNRCDLPGPWEVVDPLGDATFVVQGAETGDAQLRIDVPAGTAHDAWTQGNFSPRLRQAVPDEDFEVTVKFDSPITLTYQLQGITVEQDEDDFIRCEFNSSVGVRLFVATLSNGVPTVRIFKVVSVAAPMYLRITRTGDSWVVAWSDDGVLWQAQPPFVHAMTVNAVGPHIGNSGVGSNASPAHSGVVDWFQWSSDPIVDEDQGPGDGCMPEECPTDTNVDGFIDVTDLVAVILDWGSDGSAHNADVDGTGFVDVADLIDVVLTWGDSPCLDQCPDVPGQIEPGPCGCGTTDIDQDFDGTPDCLDGCPFDPDKTDPGACGCDHPDDDSDEDGTADCIDGCPKDPNKTEPGSCGCGFPETDSDGDGAPDCVDGCPGDPDKTDPGTCGCGVPDTDSDGDGTPDCMDTCPGMGDCFTPHAEPGCVDASCCAAVCDVQPLCCDVAWDAGCADLAVATCASAPITIDFWYGEHQVFGAPGRPQHQFNILGRADALEGLAALAYSIDGGAMLPLSWGPDTRRLANEGDFNVEIFYADVADGAHVVTVHATDTLGATVSHSMTIDVAAGMTWPMPYTVDWSGAAEADGPVDIVDGEWSITDDGLHCDVPDYDRLFVVGDVTWSDYEVTVPITIHDVDESGYEFPSITPGIGIILRWTGHSNLFNPGAQPNQGWWPLGGVAEYVYHLNGCGPRFELYGNPFALRDSDSGCSTSVPFGQTWIWKFRVETVPGQGYLYRFKAWPQATTEPADWLLSSTEGFGTPPRGCIGFLAHHVDATFGDVQIVPIISTVDGN